MHKINVVSYDPRFLCYTGEFGIVYKAQLSKGFSTRISEIVAVKTLKGAHVHILCVMIDTLDCNYSGFLDESIVNDLLKECTRMATLDHTNVLTLIGVCLDGGPAPYIVMPFMFNGSLHSHLKKERSNLVVSPDQESDTDNVGIISWGEMIVVFSERLQLFL